MAIKLSSALSNFNRFFGESELLNSVIAYAASISELIASSLSGEVPSDEEASDGMSGFLLVLTSGVLRFKNVKLFAAIWSLSAFAFETNLGGADFAWGSRVLAVEFLGGVLRSALAAPNPFGPTFLHPTQRQFLVQ